MCTSRTSQDGKIGRDTWTQQEGLAHDPARTWEWAYGTVPGYYLLGGTKVVTRVLWSEGCDPACIRDPTIERYPLSVNR